MNYYYSNENSQSVGPCTAEQMRELHRQGKLREDSWVIEEGETEWKSYAALFPQPIDQGRNSGSAKCCPSCGAENKDQARFCAGCGAKLEIQQLPETTRDHARNDERKPPKARYAVKICVGILVCVALLLMPKLFRSRSWTSQDTRALEAFEAARMDAPFTEVEIGTVPSAAKIESARTSIALAQFFRKAGFDFTILETVGVGQDEIDIAGHADATVVVLVPGMGDDVQAIKAGIMEIADLFVINKADRPGVEQTQREIEAMLSLGHTQVPLFRTVAIDGTGVAELTDALEARERRPQTAKPITCALDHLGIAVRSIEDSLPFYAAQLGLEIASRETVEHEKVKLAMLPAGQARIELLEALSPDSGIAKFIEKRGPGLHHVALRVPDLNATIARLEAAGVRLLGAPQQGAGGHTYVFVHPAASGGVLWELIQS